MEGKKLTAKQKKFCQEYLIDLNATQAAIRAGYNEKTAYNTASENMRKPYISDYISYLMTKRSERTEITADMVVKELAKIGFSNIQDFVNGGNSILELKHLESGKTAAVSGVKTTIRSDGDIVTEIKLYDKVSALEKIGRHLGIFEKDNKQKEPGPVVIKNYLDPKTIPTDALKSIANARKSKSSK